MVQWRVYYDDGTTFSGNKGAPKDAPSLGVICIAQSDVRLGRKVIHGWDWYYWHRDGYWECADVYGLHDQLLMRPSNVECVMMGRMINKTSYEEITKIARDSENGLPARSARDSHESPGAP